jgi:hypothetical protein
VAIRCRWMQRIARVPVQLLRRRCLSSGTLSTSEPYRPLSILDVRSAASLVRLGRRGPSLWWPVEGWRRALITAVRASHGGARSPSPRALFRNRMQRRTLLVSRADSEQGVASSPAATSPKAPARHEWWKAPSPPKAPPSSPQSTNDHWAGQPGQPVRRIMNRRRLRAHSSALPRYRITADPPALRGGGGGARAPRPARSCGIFIRVGTASTTPGLLGPSGKNRGEGRGGRKFSESGASQQC